MTLFAQVLRAATSAESCNRAEADPEPVRLDASDPDCLQGRHLTFWQRS
jgi:hypothetical protein